MAKEPRQLLLASSQSAQRIAKRGIIKSDDLSRTDRERLLKKGWLIPIIKGWYMLAKPGTDLGESTTWSTAYWDFISFYLQNRFADQYCLSPDSSLDLQLGSTVRPKSLLVMTKKGGASVLPLPHNCSLVTYVEKQNFPQDVEIVNGICAMPLALALCRVSATFFSKSPQQAEIALRLIRDATELTRYLLKGGYVAAAERLIGAYRFLHKDKIADDIFNSMVNAGYKVVPKNPFIIKQPLLGSGLLIRSPYVARILSLWEIMREPIIDIFPPAPGMPKNRRQYFKGVKERFVHDAYNSLSIEGYQVTEELIKKIASGKWNPQQSMSDKEEYNALAAKGYLHSFEAVLDSIKKIFAEQNPGKVLRNDLMQWYQALFSSLVQAGILTKERLIGYRQQPVMIRGSQHVPLPKEAIIDAMDAFYTCLQEESEASVRAVLGHFIFVFIHPFIDGNGRIARFLMNAMFASGGYPWTIILLKNRNKYMRTLETASVKQNIKPFAEFVYQSVYNVI